jgi:hypothetical protein
VKTFIRSADIYQCDFWELPAVQQLAQDKASAPLLQLLNVMLQGDLQGKRGMHGMNMVGRVHVHVHDVSGQQLGGAGHSLSIPAAAVERHAAGRPARSEGHGMNVVDLVHAACRGYID